MASAFAVGNCTSALYTSIQFFNLSHSGSCVYVGKVAHALIAAAFKPVRDSLRLRLRGPMSSYNGTSYTPASPSVRVDVSIIASGSAGWVSSKPLSPFLQNFVSLIKYELLLSNAMTKCLPVSWCRLSSVEPTESKFATEGPPVCSIVPITGAFPAYFMRFVDPSPHCTLPGKGRFEPGIYMLSSLQTVVPAPVSMSVCGALWTGRFMAAEATTPLCVRRWALREFLTFMFRACIRLINSSRVPSLAGTCPMSLRLACCVCMAEAGEYCIAAALECALRCWLLALFDCSPPSLDHG